MTTLSPEQERALDESGGGPVRVEDPESRGAYVLLHADLDEAVRALLEAVPVEEMDPLLGESFREGWDDPALDAYDVLDPSRSWGSQAGIRRFTGSRGLVPAHIRLRVPRIGRLSPRVRHG